MSISPVSSLSIYEYYYSINNNNKKKESPIAEEMREYGLQPTDNETLNISLLQRAKQQATQEKTQEESTSYYDRPWSDLMNQLNITYNTNPADDIADIQTALDKLISGIKDEELEQEVTELKNYVQDLYVDYQSMNQKTFDTSTTLASQLNAIASYNIASI